MAADRAEQLERAREIAFEIFAQRSPGRVRAGPQVGETARRANRDCERRDRFPMISRSDEAGLVSWMRRSVLRLLPSCRKSLEFLVLPFLPGKVDDVRV